MWLRGSRHRTRNAARGSNLFESSNLSISAFWCYTFIYKYMKNKKPLIIKIFLIIIIILLTLWSISIIQKRSLNKINSNQNTSNQNNNILNSTSSVSVNESNDFYTIKATYPTDPLDKEGVIKSVVESWINQDREDWKIGGDIYNSEQKLRKIYPDMSKAAYELNIQYTKEISEKYQTVTYRITKYEFTGGAHGNTSLATFTFDKNGQIKIEDILNFENKNDIFLTRILKTHLISLIDKDNLQEDMMDQGLGLAFLDKNDNFVKAKCDCDGFLFPSNFQNFSVLDEGVKFIMNTYQVGPGTLGNPEAIISWTELKPYLSTKFILK